MIIAKDFFCMIQVVPTKKSIKIWVFCLMKYISQCYVEVQQQRHAQVDTSSWNNVHFGQHLQTPRNNKVTCCKDLLFLFWHNIGHAYRERHINLDILSYEIYIVILPKTLLAKICSDRCLYRMSVRPPETIKLLVAKIYCQFLA